MGFPGRLSKQVELVAAQGWVPAGRVQGFSSISNIQQRLKSHFRHRVLTLSQADKELPQGSHQEVWFPGKRLFEADCGVV
jgi:hypothetical protein